MNLLLTGSTGFVGRNFLLNCIHEGRYQKIFLPLRSPEKLRAQLLGDGLDAIPASVHPLTWSARDGFPEINEPIDHVVHCAGLLNGRTQDAYLSTNVEGTVRVLERCQGAQRIVILSSQAAAGPCSDDAARTEVEIENPVTWYGKSKLEMEKRILEKFSELPMVILRPPMVLGARDSATLPLFKMARFPVRFKPGTRPKAYSFIAVFDLQGAINRVLWANTEPGRLTQKVYFVAHRTPVSDRDLINAAARSMNRFGFTVPLPLPILRTISLAVESIPTLQRAIPNLSRDRAREIWPDRWVISPRLFESTFQWMASTELRPAVQQAKDWYTRAGLL